MKRYIWIILFLIMHIYGTAFADEGLIKPDGTVVLPPIFDSIQHDNDGNYRLVKDGCVGWADHDGKIIVPPIWDFVSAFSEGLCLVAHDGLFGYVDKQGNTVMEPKWPLAFSFYNGYAMIAYPLDEHGNVMQRFEATSTWAYYTDMREGGTSDLYELYNWDNYRTIKQLSEPSNSPSFAWGVIDRSGKFVVIPTTQNTDALIDRYAGLDRQAQYPSDDYSAANDWYANQKELTIDNASNQILDNQGNVLSDHLQDERGNALPSDWLHIEPALQEGQFIGYAECITPCTDGFPFSTAYQVYILQPAEGIGNLLPYLSLAIDSDKNCYIGYAKLGADLLNANAEVVYSLPFGQFLSYNHELFLINKALPISVFTHTEVLAMDRIQILALCGQPTDQDVATETGYERLWYGDSYFEFDAATLMRFGTTRSYPIKPNVPALFEHNAVHRSESYVFVYLALVTPNSVLLQKDYLSEEASELLNKDRKDFAERYFPGYAPDSILVFDGFIDSTTDRLLLYDSAYNADDPVCLLNYTLFYQGLCEGDNRYEQRGYAWGYNDLGGLPLDTEWIETLECHGGRFFWNASVDRQ